MTADKRGLIENLRERIADSRGLSDDDRVGAYLGMLSSLDAVAEREGTEDYDEWREAADEG